MSALPSYTHGAWPSASYMADYGQKLIDGGFRPIPIEPRKKWPARVDNRGGWINLGWEQYKTTPITPSHIRMWGSWSECGIGIICGDVVAVDVDLNDQDQCDLAYGIFNRMLGATPAVRIGRPPRRLLVYRTETSFKKISGGPIEILADGQQFVAYGIHPDGHEYRWVGERLDELTLADLPVVTEAQVRAAVDAVLAALPETVTKGARVAVEPEDRSEHQTSVYGLRGTREGIAAALEVIPNNDLKWDDWNKVGMAIYAALSPDGFDLFDKWSQKSTTKYNSSKDETSSTRWDAYTRSPPDRGGAGTIYHLAEETGWRLDPSIDKHPRPDNSHVDISALLRPAVAPDAHQDEPERDRSSEEVLEPREVEVDLELPDAFTRGEGLLFDIVDFICATARKPNRPLALAAAIATIATTIGRSIVGPTGLGPQMMLVVLAGTGGGKDHPQRCISKMLRAAGLPHLLGPGDFTSSTAILQTLSRQPLCVAVMDEYGEHLKRILNPRQSYGQDITKLLRTIYSINSDYLPPMAYATRNPVTVYFPALTIFGCSTFDQFFDCLAGKDIVSGFLNRFIVFATRKKVPTSDVEIPGEVPSTIVEGLQWLARIADGDGDQGALKRQQTADAVVKVIRADWGEGAKEVFTTFSKMCDAVREAEGSEADLYRSTGENALKLAHVHAAAVAGDPFTLTVEDVRWGCDVALWSTRLMVSLAEKYISDNQDQRDYKTVQERIRAKGGKVTRRVLAQSFNGRFLSRRLDEILSSLVGAGEIEIEQEAPRGGGHKVHIIRLKR
jgi:hypothetical protein